MRIVTPAIYAALLGAAIYAAIVQSPLPNAIASAPPEGVPTKLAYAVASDSKGAGATRVGKRESCRQSVSTKNLGKHQARDQMQLCVAQARVECLKQAIDQKLRGAARRVYVKSCVAA